jgi:hypothetical protein
MGCAVLCVKKMTVRVPLSECEMNVIFLARMTNGDDVRLGRVIVVFC